METKKNFLAAFLVTGIIFMVAAFGGCTADGDELKTSAFLADNSDYSGDSTEADPDGINWGDESYEDQDSDSREGYYVEEDDYEDGTYDDNYSEDNYYDDNYEDGDYEDGYSGEDYYVEDDDYDDGTYEDNYSDDDSYDDNYEDGTYEDNYYDDEDSGDENWDENGEEHWNNGEWNNQGDQGQCLEDAECKEKELKNDYRDIQRIEREIEHMIKKDEGPEDELQALLDKLESLKEDLDNAVTYDELSEIREQIWPINDELNNYRMEKEIERRTKELERQEKQFEKDREYLGDMKESVSDEWADKIDEQLDRMERVIELQKEIIAAMEEGQNWDEFEDLIWELDDLFWSMDDFWWEFEEIKIVEWFGQMLEEVERGIEDFQTNEYPFLPAATQLVADDIIEVALGLIEEGRSAQEDMDTEKMEDLQWRLEELGMKAENLFGKPNPEFNELGFSDDFDMKFEDYSDDMSYEKQLEIVEKILSANPDILEQILLGDPLLAEKTLKILGKIPDEMQADYLEKKAALIGAYEEAFAADYKIAEHKEEILGFNYFGDAMDTLIEYLEEVRDGSLTVDELVAELEVLKEESKEAKHQAGVVSFPDYDDSDWYYESVEEMGDFLSGKKQNDGSFNFAGGDNITFAETLKISLEKFGIEAKVGSPSYTAAQNHWAKGYYVAAEGMGITLLEPDHLISRGEMARLIIEITIGSPNSYSTSSFSDLKTSDPYFNYLETLYEYGIINGDNVASGLPTVRSSDNINRAETAKIVSKAYEELQLFTIDAEGLGYLLEGL